MRFLFVTSSFPRRAGDPSGHFVETEVMELRAAGHEVHVIAPTHSAFEFPGIVANIRLAPTAAPGAMASWMRALALTADAKNADRIVCHWPMPNALPFLLGKHAPLELVSHGADVRLLLAMPQAIRERIVSRLAHLAEGWRFVAEHLRDSLLASLSPRAREEVTRIARVQAPPISVTVDESIQQRLASKAHAGEVLVSVGRLIPSKRVERAITHSVSRPNAHLYVIGDGPERARLEIHAAPGRVTFLGTLPRAETLAWIARADELLFASEAEGLSTVCREAEALGTRITVI